MRKCSIAVYETIAVSLTVSYSSDQDSPVKYNNMAQSLPISLDYYEEIVVKFATTVIYHYLAAHIVLVC